MILVGNGYTPAPAGGLVGISAAGRGEGVDSAAPTVSAVELYRYCAADDLIIQLPTAGWPGPVVDRDYTAARSPGYSPGAGMRTLRRGQGRSSVKRYRLELTGELAYRGAQIGPLGHVK